MTAQPPDTIEAALSDFWDQIPSGTMLCLPCSCWTWAITPEMGDYRTDGRGIYHHPQCLSLEIVSVEPAPEARPSGAAGEGEA